MEKLQKNQIHTAQITGYTAEGAGVTRIGGQVVFVPGAARGDTLEVRIVKECKNFAYGKVERIVTPSPHRVEPACPAFPKCGGCDFWHIDYAEELSLKQQRVQDAMQRIGGFELPLPHIYPSPQVEDYRNKAQFPMGRQADGTVYFGFYRSRSHDIVPLQRCAIQDPGATALAQAVCRWAQVHRVSVYDEVRHEGLLRHVYVRTGAGGTLLCIVANGERLPAADALVELARQTCPDLQGVVLNVNTEKTNRVLGDRQVTLWGQPRLETAICGNRFLLSPQSFYQVNQQQAQQLYDGVLRLAELQPEQLALDLYCGIGTITLALAARCGSVIGVEIVPQAIEDAKESARRNGAENVSFLCADAAQAAAELAKQGLRPQTVVCDPPRKGMDQQALQAVLDMAPRRIVYVSCDCASLARDARILADGGYRLETVEAYDMFPRTANVESLALLIRE